MAQTSKQKQAIRRAKRRATVAERYITLTETVLPQLQKRLQEVSTENYLVKAMLYAALAQQGGQLELTKGTLAQVVENYARLRVENRPKEGDEQTLVMTLVEEPLPIEEKPALEIRKIEDEPAVEPFPGSSEVAVG